MAYAVSMNSDDGFLLRKEGRTAKAGVVLSIVLFDAIIIQ